MDRQKTVRHQITPVLFMLLLFLSTGCFEKGEVSLAGLNSLKAGVHKISNQNGKLVIEGQNLDTTRKVVLKGDSLDNEMVIQSQNESKIVAALSQALTLTASTVYELILSNAHGQSVYQLSFEIQDGQVTTVKLADGAVTGAKISDMGALSGQVLKYNGTSWNAADLNSLVYAGTWDASTGTQPSASPVGGDFWIVDTDGDVDLGDGNGLRQWRVGDWIVYNDVTTQWDQVISSQSVVSFNGRAGEVVPDTNDYTWQQIDKTTAPIDDLTDVDTTSVAPATGEVLKWDGTNWTPQADDGGSGDITSVTAGTGLTGGATTGDATLDVDVGTGSGQIPQLDASGLLLNSIIPGLDAAKVTSGTMDAARLPLATDLVDGIITAAEHAKLNSTDTTLSGGSAGEYLDGDGSWKVLNTSAVPEGTNLYYTAAAARADVVDDAIGDGVTNKAPSQNAVFDALALKADDGSLSDYVLKAGDTMGGALGLPVDGLSVGTDQLVTSGGNVGVGTSTPAYSLDVDGIIRATNFLTGNNQEVSGMGLLKTISSPSGDQVVGRYYEIGQFFLSELTGNMRIKVSITGNSVAQSYDFIFSPSFAFAEYTATSTNWVLVYPERRFERSANIPDEWALAVQWAGSHRFNMRILKTEQGGSYATNGRTIYVSAIDPTGGSYVVTDVTGTGTMATPTDIAFSGPLYDANVGNLGVGTGTPSYPLHVVGNGANHQIRVEKTSMGNINLGVDSTGGFVETQSGIPLRFHESNAEQVRITGGLVGIGTASPTEKLEVNGNVKATAFYGDGSNLTGVSSTSSSNTGDNTVVADSDSDTNGQILFQTAGTTKAVIDNSGNMGVGISSPAEKLEVQGNIHAKASNIMVSNGGSAYGTSMYSPASNELAFSANSTEAIRVDSAGNVGIGTSTPNAKLDVNGKVLFGDSSTNYDSMELETMSTPLAGYEGTTEMKAATIPGSGEAAHAFHFKTIGSTGVTRADVLVDGNVGIGTTSPDQKLDVTHTSASYGTAGIISQRSDTGDNVGVGIYNSVQKWDLANITSAGTDYFGIRDSTQATTPFAITTTGNVGVGTSSPSEKLDIGGSDGEDLALKFSTMSGGNSTRSIIENNASTGMLTFTADQGQNGSSRGFKFIAGASDALNIDSVGNVGIGTTTPQHELQIGDGSTTNPPTLALKGHANTGIGGKIYFEPEDGSDRFVIDAEFDGTTANDLLTFEAGNASDILVLKGNGNVGIGTSTPASPFNIASPTSGSGNLRQTNGNSNSDLVDVTGATGDVHLDHIVSATYSATSATTIGKAVTFKIDGAPDVSDVDLTTGDPLAFWVQGDNAAFGGNVGIGTTAPSAELHVAKDNTGGDEITALRLTELIGTDAHYELRVTNTSGSTGEVNYFSIWGGEAGSEADKFILTRTGNAGIGTVSPADKLHVAGDVRVGTGTTGCVKDADATVIAGTCSSDERFKKDIRELEKTGPKLAQLRPVRYFWRKEEFPDKHFGESEQIGLIAQEVAKVFPELVERDEEGFYRVRYSDLNMMMLQGLGEHQEQLEEVQELKREIASIKAEKDAEIAELKAKNQEMENFLCKKFSDASFCQ